MNIPLRLSCLVCLAFLLNGCFHVFLSGPVTEAQVSIAPLRAPDAQIELLVTPTPAQTREAFGAMEWDETPEALQLVYAGSIEPDGTLYDPGALYLVTVRAGGDDNDVDDDRAFDDTPTRVYGTLHAIVTGDQLTRNVSIGGLTDAMYRTLESRLAGLSDMEVMAELDTLSAGVLDDINGSGDVTYEDAVRWVRHANPAAYTGDLDDYDAFAAAIRNNEPEDELKALAERLLAMGGTDNTPPSNVMIETPPGGTSYTGAGNIEISAFAQDEVGVTRVEFYANGVRKRTDTRAPWGYTQMISAASNGSYAITARAYDAAGNSTDSAPVNITINIPSGGGEDINTGVWELRSPSLQSDGVTDFLVTYDDNLNVTELSYNFKGTQRTYSGSDIHRSEVDVASEDLVDIEIEWGSSDEVDNDVVIAGQLNQTRDVVEGYLAYQIKEEGFPRLITFNANGTLVEQAGSGSSPDGVSPSVSISSPNPGETFTEAGTVTISASASDDVGVTRVEFYRNRQLLNVDNQAPYSHQMSISAASNGEYDLTAKAFDAAGNSATSSPVPITVDISSGGGEAPSAGTWALASRSLSIDGITDFFITFDDNLRATKVAYRLHGGRREFTGSAIDRSDYDVNGNQVQIEVEWDDDESNLYFEGTLNGSRQVLTGTLTYAIKEGWNIEIELGSNATLTKQ